MAESNSRELHTPEDVTSAEQAIEVMRVWIIDKHLQCSLSAGVFEDYTQWGTLLAELAQHISSAMHEVHGADAQETLQMILAGFQKELIKS
jgi:hypothetical protein